MVVSPSSEAEREMEAGGGPAEGEMDLTTNMRLYSDCLERRPLYEHFPGSLATPRSTFERPVHL